ncbi:DUF4232 domain-containing protein [Kitasatospora sp. NRRL B-11411]|uniref:DUF4232 domain-containing protein n=1 Tax=Kitasatospora sp. NRRL B-11411 TaxID=1463822 RepID=UPI0004C3C63A|nr:DUF4232 domain-containing protein [Kitasatospora sp. NRRL B-11411]
MRTATRLTATAAVALLAGLGLTACNDDAATTATAPTSAAAPASGTAAAPAGGTAASPAGSTGGTGTAASPKAGGSTKCTAQDVKLTVTGPAGRASEQQPARAEVRAQNTSGKPCTLTGFPGVRLTDNEGKAGPLDAVRQGGANAATVTLQPGKSAAAPLIYSDVNLQGSASGRLVCAVQGSKLAVILPDTTQQSQVPVTGGVDNGTLNVCGDLTVGPFETAA